LAALAAGHRCRPSLWLSLPADAAGHRCEPSLRPSLPAIAASRRCRLSLLASHHCSLLPSLLLQPSLRQSL
jgi:hypothetical protein